MKEFVSHLYLFFLHLGAVGLLLMGILDSSFLFMPLGNDLLILGLVANHHDRLPLYVLMASMGSALGCIAVDWVARKNGEEGLQHFVSKRRLEYVKRKVKNNAGWALAVAALMPPPFPFTGFMAAVAAFKYPRKKFYAIIVAARCVRFTIIGLLGILFGRRILQWAESPAVHIFILVVVGLSVVGSVMSIYRWLQRASRGRRPLPAEGA